MRKETRHGYGGTILIIIRMACTRRRIAMTDWDGIATVLVAGIPIAMLLFTLLIVVILLLGD